jgi:hypothetical protein
LPFVDGEVRGGWAVLPLRDEDFVAVGGLHFLGCYGSVSFLAFSSKFEKRDTYRV